MGAQAKIDKIDVIILKTLLNDARANFTDIAQKCKVSVNTIAKRYQKLKRTGVIVGTAVRLDTRVLKYKYRLAIDINVESEYEKSIIEAIRRLPHFFAAYRVIGKYDIHAAVGVESVAKIQHIRDIIKKQKGVSKIAVAASLDKIVMFPKNLLIETTEDMKNE